MLGEYPCQLIQLTECNYHITQVSECHKRQWMPWKQPQHTTQHCEYPTPVYRQPKNMNTDANGCQKQWKPLWRPNQPKCQPVQPPQMWAAHPTLKRAPPLIVVADTNMNTNRTCMQCLSTLSQTLVCGAQCQQTVDGEDLVGTWGWCHVHWRVTILEVEGLSPPTSPVSCNVYSIPSCTIDCP